MDSSLLSKIQPDKGFKYIFYILFSYFLFIFITALFGNGHTAATSLLIILFAFFISSTSLIYLLRRTLFIKVDYIIVLLIFFLQSSIGIIHFITVINPEYFLENIAGVDIENGYYYWDIFYFSYLIDLIAESRLEEGYLSVNLLEGGIHKNYFLAYMLSDLFYFGDAYPLNLIAINMLSIFYSGILLSLICHYIFKITNLIKLRTVFYLTIMQPMAWIPSHSMRDIFGAFIIVLGVSMIFFAHGRSQKIFSYLFSMILVFQHRSIYAVSIIFAIFAQNSLRLKDIINNIWLVLALLILSIFVLLGSDYALSFINIFVSSQENSMLSGSINDRNAGIIEHFIKLIIGPFPWTQFYDGSVVGYSSYYASTQILNSSWTLTIIFLLFKNIKNIYKSYENRQLFFTILLFGVPAVFSLGGMNLYLLPSTFLSIPLLVILVPVKRIVLTFSTITLLYILTSGIFYFAKYHFF